MITVIKCSQVPKRDAETMENNQEKWRVFSARMDCPVEEPPRALCDGLELLLDRLNAIHIDAANALLRLIAPVTM